MKFEHKFLLLYLTIGFVWIFFSDSLASQFAKNSEVLAHIQNFKGSIYVLVSGVMFFLLIRIHLKKRREAEAHAKRNDDLKTAFLQNISHEIRTPMNGIVGFSNLIKNNMYDSKNELDQFLDLITDSSNRLLSTIEDIVEISKIESHNATSNIEEFDVNELMENTYNMFEEKISDKQNFKLELPQSSLKIRIVSDKSKLEKVLKALTHNAIKFCESGTITLGYKDAGNELFFFVKDTGMGIPKEMQKNIFNRFMYADIQTADNFGGMGLGLALSKEIVDLLGGTIEVESEPGKGSEFYFKIPKMTISSN